MPKVLFDTTAYVDFSQAGRHMRQAWAINTLKHAAAYARQSGKPGLSTLSIMEIVQGYEEHLLTAKLQAFQTQSVPMFEIIGFDAAAAYLAGEIFAKLEAARPRIGIPDTGIAAIAVQHGFTLVTANTKHYQRVIDLGYSLTLENWRDA